MENIVIFMDNLIMKEHFVFIPALQNHSPLRLQLAGISYCDGSYRIARPAQEIFVLEYVEQGSGFLKVKDKYLYPQAGDVYIAPGWCRHSYGSDAGTPWVKYWFNLGGPLMEELLKVYEIDDRFLFKNASRAGRLIKTGVLALEKLSLNQVQSFMETRLLQIVRALADHPDAIGRHSTKAVTAAGEALRNFLLEHITQPPPALKTLAALINRSEVQTLRIFKAEFGQTPHEFLLDQKARAAAELLRNSNGTLKEIAFLLGFRDEYYFSRFFKKRKGISPIAYRHCEQ